jgi:hypothetical protein
MKILKKLMFTTFFILLATGVSIAATTEDDLSELTRIANLQGESYLKERDDFVQSRTEPVDMDKAIERGWAEGLLALIVNARITKPEWFHGWDGSGFGETISGAPSWSPNPAPYNDPTNLELGQNINIFKIEKLWKFYESSLDIKEWRKQKNTIPKWVWPKNVLDKEIQHYFVPKVDVSGQEDLWKKVALETTNHSLMIIACHALPAFESRATENILKDKLQQAPNDVKMAIIRALEGHNPRYASAILKDTYPNWKKDISLAYMGFRVFSIQPTGSGSRRFVKEVIADSNEPTDIREVAISAMSISTARNVNDIPFLREILESSEHIKLRRKAAYSLRVQPNTLIRTIMYKVLETETDQFILSQSFYFIERLEHYDNVGIRVIEHSEREDILGHLEKFFKRQDIPEESRKRAKITKDRIAGKIKAKKPQAPPSK